MPASMPHPASFRDRSGFLFTSAGELFRQINPSYQSDYELLMSSGLYAELVKREFLVAHEPAPDVAGASDECWLVIRPQRIPFISYPYEWCPEQLRDAALLTLKIQRLALRYGMSLKDASAFNVQFIGAKPVFIDTLSFERYGGGAWRAYRQFCQHFLAPLALMHLRDAHLGQLLRTNIDGVPLALASMLLPRRSWLNFGLAVHLHLHARAQSRYADRAADSRTSQVARADQKLGQKQLDALIVQLASTVRGLKHRTRRTEWGEYYDATNYSDAAMLRKEELVREFLAEVQPAAELALDLGANTGRFSRIATEFATNVISWDIDPVAVQRNYVALRAGGNANILPLLQDLTNPSPALGWAHEERASFSQRGEAGVVMALALIHHLAISNNVPLGQVADFFARLCRYLIIEFVPKDDSQVRRLLATRADIFDDYTIAGFRAAFAGRFELVREKPIEGTVRTLFVFRTITSS